LSVGLINEVCMFCYETFGMTVNCFLIKSLLLLMAPNVISISKTAYVSAGMLQFYIRMNNVNVLAIVVGLQVSAAWYMAVTAAKQGY